MKWLTLAVAGYAAVVATVDLIWRVWERRRAAASVVSLTTVWITRREKIIGLEVRNLSPEAVRIRWFAWCNEGEGPRSWTGYEDGTGPEVPARDGRVIERPAAEVLDRAGIDRTRRIVAVVRLTTGEEFTSPPTSIPEGHALDTVGESPAAEPTRKEATEVSDHEGDSGFKEEPADDGINVWWEPVRVRAEEIEAELPDGTRLKPIPLLEGRRLGFDRPLPAGTVIYRSNRRVGVVGASSSG